MISRISNILIVSIMKIRWRLAALTPSSRLIILIPAFWLLCALGTLPLASAQEGTLEWGKITSPALAGNLIGDSNIRRFAIYLPPSYNTSDKHYPVFYDLGAGNGHIGNEVTLLPNTIDLMIQNRDIREMIVVFPDISNRFGGSKCLSSPTIGDYETYITTDLVNHIDANYRTIADRESRGILGASGTGFGAMHLALKFPEVFSTVVVQESYYDADSDWYKDLARGTAFANPKNWAEFQGVFWLTQDLLSISAGVSPNPDKPPLFLDKPFELVDNKPQIVPEAWQQHVDADVVHGDLSRYLEQPVRLNGIMFMHGRNDDLIPVSQAQALDKAMTDLGVAHVYEELGGGHGTTAGRYREIIQFFSEHLLEEVSAVDARGKLGVTWGEIKQGQ